MKQKQKKKTQILNSEAFNWCVDNDFQVYVKPVNDRGRFEYKVAVRRGGITTEGKDYIIIDNIKHESVETVGNQIFMSPEDASYCAFSVMEQLKKKYG